MNCTECGFKCWSEESIKNKAHPECVDDELDNNDELETHLEKALDDN
jgi:hypothetical protein